MVVLKLHFADENDAKKIGTGMHEALAGSKAYIENDICLNIDTPKLLEITLGCAEETASDHVLEVDIQ